MYIFDLVELLGISRPEIFYRCKDLERMELIESQALTDLLYSPAPSVTRLAKLGSNHCSASRYKNETNLPVSRALRIVVSTGRGMWQVSVDSSGRFWSIYLTTSGVVRP